MNTLGVQGASQLLRISPDALLRKVRRGIVPAAKVGREWVFVEADLIALIREQAKERACHSIAILRARTGGSDSQSGESRLDAHLKQLIGKPPKNLRANFELIGGGRSSSETSPVTPGAKLSLIGGSRHKAAGKSGTGSG